MNSKLLFFLLAFLPSTMISCGGEKKPDSELILGVWKLNQALRNDKITNSVDGMYMSFDDAKSFDSNILGDSSSYSVRIVNKKIKLDHDLLDIFEIIELTDSTMKLQFEINGDELLLIFNK